MGRYKGARKPPAQKKPPLTHFLCLPLVTPESRPQLEASMKRFRDSVSKPDPASASDLRRGDEAGLNKQETLGSDVHPRAIRPIGALHCTLGVMGLSKGQLEEAVKLLEGLDVSAMLQEARTGGGPERAAVSQQSAENKFESVPASLGQPISPPKIGRSVTPLTVGLKGLVSMHEQHKTSILYSAPSDSTERLYPFCVALQKLFADKGFLIPDDRQLKLHATVVNTIYAKGRKQAPKRNAKQQTPIAEPAALTEQANAAGEKSSLGGQPAVGAQDDRSQGHGPHANAPLKMDATAVLEKFKDFVWADNVVLDRIAICEMGAKKFTDAEGKAVGEEYIEVACLKLPATEPR